MTTLLEEVTTAPARPIYDLMKLRAETDWGEAPKYTAEYRKIRWPGTPSRPVHYRPLTPEEISNRNRPGIWNLQLESQLVPGHVEVHSSDPGITRTLRHRIRPGWIDYMRYQRRTKASGSWSIMRTRGILKEDMIKCMSNNIPFKTKTFEYKPSDQWMYVHGVRAMKYSIVTGYICEISFSGVYNKVTSLLFRMFGIRIQRMGRKLVWMDDWRRRQGTTDIFPSQYTVRNQIVHLDINQVYTYDYFYSGAPPWKGFFKINSNLFNEFYRAQQQNGIEVESGHEHRGIARPSGTW